MSTGQNQGVFLMNHPLTALSSSPHQDHPDYHPNTLLLPTWTLHDSRPHASRDIGDLEAQGWGIEIGMSQK